MQTGIYQHYKGQKYQVIDTVRHSETQERLVLYRALYGEKGLWVRPYTMFFESIVLDSKEVPRFQFIGEVNE